MLSRKVSYVVKKYFSIFRSEKKDSLEVQPAASLPNGTAGVQQFLNALLHDFSIPKGLYIYRG